MLQMQSASILSGSPTFNSYSSTRLAEIASRVVEEIKREEEEEEEEEVEGNLEDFLFSETAAQLKQMSLHPLQEEEEEEEEEEISSELSQPEITAVEITGEGGEEEEEGDFEFAFVPRDPDALPIPADNLFTNGQIRPIWPIFNRDLIFSESSDSGETNPEQNPGPSIRLSMRKLLTEDSNRPSPSQPSSSSESEALDGIPTGSYCIWTPRSARPEPSTSSPAGCKKSKSTGSSKVWRFRDLMHRSSSNGQDTMVFLSTDAISKGGKNKKAMALKEREAVVVGGKKGENKREVSAHEMYVRNRRVVEGNRQRKVVGRRVVSAHEIYLRKRKMSEGDRPRSFLPYKQDIVGFFANVNGLSRSLHPF